MADDDIREGSPKPKKKKAAPPPDDDDRPAKKRPRADDDEPPRKKKKPDPDEDEENEEEETKDLGSSPLSAIIPVGGNVFGLLSMWLAIFALALALVAVGVYLEVITILGKIPALLAVAMPTCWPVAILAGGLAFLTFKKKANYGAISGNLRAIGGILLGLIVAVMHVFLIYVHFIK